MSSLIPSKAPQSGQGRHFPLVWIKEQAQSFSRRLVHAASVWHGLAFSPGFHSLPTTLTVQRLLALAPVPALGPSSAEQARLAGAESGAERMPDPQHSCEPLPTFGACRPLCRALPVAGAGVSDSVTPGNTPAQAKCRKERKLLSGL